MMTDTVLNEDLEIISSSETSPEEEVTEQSEPNIRNRAEKSPDEDPEEDPSPIYEDHEQVRGFASIMSSEIYVVEVNGEVVFYNKNLGHARRQAYKLTQNIMFTQPTWYRYHIDQPDHNTFVLTGVSKFCLISYDTPIATVLVRPLYRVRENQW